VIDHQSFLNSACRVKNGIVLLSPVCGRDIKCQSDRDVSILRLKSRLRERSERESNKDLPFATNILTLSARNLIRRADCVNELALLVPVLRCGERWRPDLVAFGQRLRSVLIVLDPQET
jgi:hypothetical protein